MAKNVKQSKQKKSVLNKLGGLSKRSKFIVVVLIFAVLGGGYLTYKSFAATGTYIYTVANGQLTAGAGSSVIPGSTGKGKNGESIILVPRTTGNVVLPNASIPAFQVRVVCITAKKYDSTDKYGRILVTMYNSTKREGIYIGTGYGTVSGDLGNGYKEYCSDRSVSNNFTGPISIQNGNVGATSIYITSAKIMFVQ